MQTKSVIRIDDNNICDIYENLLIGFLMWEKTLTIWNAMLWEKPSGCNNNNNTCDTNVEYQIWFFLYNLFLSYKNSKIKVTHTYRPFAKNVIFGFRGLHNV